MADQWMIRGPEFVNCNCAWGCPCQFGSPTTNGFCEAVAAGIVEEGHFNDVSLDGVKWVSLLHWPGEISDGNGTAQTIIEESASDDQREALGKILAGESTKPGATHFAVFATTMTTVLETLYVPIELSIDIEERTADLKVNGLVESTGRPIISGFDGEPVRSRIHLPNGFEYTYAEMGNASTTSSAGIKLELEDSYGAFCELHMTQDGVVR